MGTESLKEFGKKLPKFIYREHDDDPAGRAVLWTILINVAILAGIYYLLFLKSV